MINKKNLATATLVLGVAGLAAWAYAQPGLSIESNFSQPQPNVHRVRVVNEMGFPIRLKIVGFRYAAHFVVDLQPNQSVSQRFYGGERLVCAWDPSRRLELNAAVNFNQPGTLRLRPIGFAPPKSVLGTTHAYEALPRLELQP